jgi:MscS family membrane protein
MISLKNRGAKMFEELFSKTYYQNTILEWSIALALIVVTVVFAKMIYVGAGSFVKKVTKKTKNEFDDLLVDMLEEPMVFAIIILGVWYSLQTLNMTEVAESILGRAYYILIIFDVAWLLSRLMDAVVKKYVQPFVSKTEGKLDDQLLPLLRKGIKLSIWVVAILVALNNAGYNVSALLASLGIGGLAFALAAKDTIANLFGSFTIFIDKPFEVGDRIVVQGYDGIVAEVGLRSTRLQTLNGRMVTLANSEVADSAIENISSEPSRKITMDLGLTYDTDETRMQRAMEILQEIAAENEALEENVVTAFTAFNDFALNIRFIYYIKKGESVFGNQTKINLEILKRFNAEKLEFAFPTQTVYANLNG